jgi:superfamily II DNA/RNA helicase
MTQDSLNRFLLDEAIKDDLNILSRLIAVSDLRNVERNQDLKPGAYEFDWARNLLAGSILARASDREAEEAALRIATGAVTISDSLAVKDSGAILFEKLSNSRAVILGREKERIEQGLPERLGVSGRLQAAYRHLENTVLLDSTGELITVNRFQRDFWSSAQSKATWLSASSPTASGKTYIVLRWLLNKIVISDVRVAVYIVPTRALVSEISDSLASMIGAQNIQDIEVSSLPLKSHYKPTSSPKKLTFILTQERLHLLANAVGDDFHIDILIVDEAHKVGDRLRGVILQDAVERVVRANPSADVIFVSPAIQNPAALLADAPEGTATISLDSDTPTVIQNVILASQVPRKPMQWALTLRRGDSELPLGTLQLAARPTNFKKRLAFIAAAVAPETGTLVYANGAAEAEEIALLISQLIPKKDPSQSKDPDLSALAQLARKGVHSAYQLARLVEAGVAFHYGNMPSLIRAEVERLFRLGKIKYLVCTSTLIEGVNLACRTIIVRGPRKGIGKPMQPHDFWNLAGRAGRWGDEFQGNIICIDPNSTDAWPTGVPKRARYPILRETDFVLNSADALEAYVGARWDAPMEEVGKASNSQFEQVSAYLLATFIREGSIISAPFAKRHDAGAVGRLNVRLAALSDKITIPAELIGRHPGVSAVGMQRLLHHFAQESDDVEKLLPAPPESDDAYKRLVSIMERINEHVYPAFFPHTLIPLHALVTNEWLRGFSLAAIIAARIKYHRKHGHSIDFARLFRDTMALVEQTARFLAPKYVAAYMDVLGFHLKAIGRSDLIGDDLDIGVMLEFGLSTRTLISLMELGLSRMSAVELYEKIAKDDLDQEGVRVWVAEYGPQLEALEVPTLIIREVRARIGWPAGDAVDEDLAGEPPA